MKKYQNHEPVLFDKPEIEFVRDAASGFALVAIAISMIFLLTACSGSGGGSGAAIAKIADGTIDNTPPADIVPPEVPPGAPVDAVVSLTYYKLVKTEAPVNGWVSKTYTASAYCVMYQSKTFCWDDGVKTIAAWVSNSYTYGPFSYTYFGLQNRLSGGFSLCHGGCTSDFMPLPRLISATVENNLTTPVINAVFTQGVPLTVSCTESAGVLNCNDFLIDLNQVAL